MPIVASKECAQVPKVAAAHLGSAGVNFAAVSGSAKYAPLSAALLLRFRDRAPSRRSEAARAQPLAYPLR